MAAFNPRSDTVPPFQLLDLRCQDWETWKEAYALGVHRGYEWDTRNLRFLYTSPTTPDETYDYDMVSRERVLRKRREVPSGHNPEDYVTRRCR